MADEVNTGVQDTGQPDQKMPEINQEVVNNYLDEKLSDIRSLYEKKVDELKAQLAGQDRKNTELQKALKEHEREKLTTKEREELERRELQQEWQKIFKERAMAKYGLVSEDIPFHEYLFGDTQETIDEKARNLRAYLDAHIQKGIETGVEQKLSQGYKPQGPAASAKNDDLANLSRQELAQKAKDLQKMPDSEAKSNALNRLMQEQVRRQVQLQ